MPEVARLKTPATVQEAVQYLTDAFREVLGAWPGSEVAALLLALSDFETGTWKSMSHWNWGNIVAHAPTEQDYYTDGDSPGANKKRVYATPQEGARALVVQLTRDSRPQWKEGLLTGDPERFVRALKGEFGGPEYFGASFERYFPGFLQRWNRYAPTDATGLTPGAIPLYPGSRNFWGVAIPGPHETFDGGLDEPHAVNPTPGLQEQIATRVWPEIASQLPGLTSDCQVVEWPPESVRESISILTNRATWPQLPSGQPYGCALVRFDFAGEHKTFAPPLASDPHYALRSVYVFDGWEPAAATSASIAATQWWARLIAGAEEQRQEVVRRSKEAIREAGGYVVEASKVLQEAGKGLAWLGLGIAGLAGLYWLSKRGRR